MRASRLIAWLVLLNAADTLALWNVFPMHPRGVAPTLTDTMHGLLAINPFPLLTIIVVTVRSEGGLRIFSLACSPSSP